MLVQAISPPQLNLNLNKIYVKTRTAKTRNGSIEVEVKKFERIVNQRNKLRKILEKRVTRS